MEVKHRFSGKVLFESKKRTLKETVVEAVSKKADLRGADLGGAYLEGADLRGADLRGAYLEGAYLVGADLRGADLVGAYLVGADLEGAYLVGADLEGADLEGADLGGADLRRIKITPKEKEFLEKWFAWEVKEVKKGVK